MPLLRTMTEGFARDQRGAITPFGLFFGVTGLMLGGVAVDMSNLIAVRTQLQVAADLAAHSALYTREFDTAANSRTKAIELVEASFPTAKFGKMLTEDDIYFGSYDQDKGGFKVDANSRTGVMVKTDRLASKSNAVASFLLKLVGYPTFDAVATSVFQAWDNPCLRDGWIAEGIVDAQSNNEFYDGYCLHSNDHVSMNQNNFIETGVSISMPDLKDLDIPASGFDKNDGLAEALRAGYINVRILDHMQDIWDHIFDPTTDYYRAYLLNSNVETLSGNAFTTTDFKKGRIHEIWCGAGASAPVVQTGTGHGNGHSGGSSSAGSGGITIDASSKTLSEVVIRTDCSIKFANNSALEDVVIYTTSASDKSITASQGLRLGADDHCDPSGGVQLMTMGGFEVAAKLEVYSSQVIAKGPIQFAAQGDGVEGASFISGATIDGTSNTVMSSCPGGGMDENFSVANFRMAG